MGTGQGGARPRGRRAQWRAVVRGEIATWGRRPWLGPLLRAMLRNP